VKDAAHAAGADLPGPAPAACGSGRTPLGSVAAGCAVLAAASIARWRSAVLKQRRNRVRRCANGAQRERADAERIDEEDSMKTIFKGLLGALLCGPVVAVAQDARPLGGMDAFASPVLVVSPKAPPLAAGDPPSVEIRLSGVIGVDGTMENPVFDNAEGRDKYVAAVREVLRLWRFKPAVDLATCTPVRSNGSVRVWFETKQGKPSVSVSMPQAGGRHEALRAGGEGALVKVTHRPRAAFPLDAREIGADGAAEVLVMLNERGENVRQTLLYSTPHSMFGEAALASARDVKIALGGAKAQCVAVPYYFCIDKDVNFPNSACEARRAKGEL
jgi:hypothetical protein